ncbi:hypothetical protein G6F56_000185 [Rhizopus delemar]|nr:hypothetical protein G6F56_000185 [Rhizopus delemar]
MSNINDLTSEQIEELLHLSRRFKDKELRDEAPSHFDLPEEIHDELENSSKIELKNKLKKFARESTKFEGGKWTQSGTINKIYLPNLRNSKWMQHKQCQLLAKEQIDCGQQAEEQQKSSWISNSLSKKEDQKKTWKPSWKNSRDWQSIHSPLEKNLTKTQRNFQQEHRVYPKVSDTWKMTKKTTKTCSSLQTLWKKYRGQDSMKSCLKEPSNNMEDSKSREETSTRALIEKEEDIAMEEAIFLVEAEAGDPHLISSPTTTPLKTPTKVFDPTEEDRKNIKKNNRKTYRKNNSASKITKTNRNTTLLYTSGRDCPRKPLTKIHIELEESDALSMALVRYQPRIPNPIPIKAYPLEIETVYTVRERSNNSKFSSKFLSSIPSNREVTNTGCEIFVKFLHNQVTHKDTSNFGLSPYQPIRTMQSFQNGGCACIERIDRTERLPLQDRSQGCIYCSTHPSRIKEISLVQAPRHGMPIPISGIWPECSPTGIFKAHEVCVGTHTCKGDPLGILLGRHMCIGKDKGGNEDILQRSPETVDFLGIHYQLSKERSDSETYSRIPRVYLQYEDYEDQRATEEVNKAYVENQTDKPNFKNSIMPVVCGITRENHSHDTSNGRSTSPYSISSTRPGKESPATAIRLGNALPFVIQGMEGIEMMGNQRRKPEWTPHTKDGGYKTTSSSDPRGRFGFRMGNNVERSGDERILDRNRKRNIDQHEGTTDDSIRSSAPRKKIQKQYDSHFFGQYNSAQICEEVGRYSFANTSRIGFGNSRDYNSTQIDNTLPTYLGGEKCQSRSTEQKGTTSVRMETPTPILQSDMGKLGAHEGGCLRNAREHQTGTILEFTTRSPSGSDRCISTNMAQDRLISTSSMEDDSEGDQETQRGQDQISSTYYPQLANPILVANDLTTKHQVTNAIPDQQTIVFDCLAITRAHEVQKNGLTPESSEYLRMSNKEATHRNYDLQWKRWVLWCRS